MSNGVSNIMTSGWGDALSKVTMVFRPKARFPKLTACYSASCPMAALDEKFELEQRQFMVVPMPKLRGISPENTDAEYATQ